MGGGASRGGGDVGVRAKQAMIPAKIGTDRTPHEERFPMARLNVNGKAYDIDVAPDTPLLWAIRENVGLTGTKYGCGIAQCGACTVLIDGVATRSCAFPASSAEGKQDTTLHGLAPNRRLPHVHRPRL